MALEALTEEVAQNLEEVAEVTRKISSRGAGFFLGGLAVGAAVGFYFGYRFNREKIKAEAFNESKLEIEKMREVYQQKTVAAQQKPSVAEVIEERGYSTKADPRLLKPPVPVNEPSVLVDDKENEIWEYAEELKARTPEMPYVIHQEERGDEGYAQVVYTYYAIDDVLVDEEDKPLPHADIIVGQNNLKWGHGSDDNDVVFVRNEHMELEMEICRVHRSYEEEVLGLDRDESN